MLTITQFTTSTIKALVLSLVLFISTAVAVSAQSTEVPSLKSRIAVVATETKTNIWVSDFPKSTSIILFDEESNIIAIQSTNDFGAAYISLPKSITSTIFAKTLNGEVNVSNKAAVKGGKHEQNIVVANDQPVEATKA
jgi:hypothetical protein